MTGFLDGVAGRTTPSAVYNAMQALTTDSCLDLAPSIKCDAEGNVITFDAGGKGLSGVLNDEFASFPKLETLSIASNNLTGTLPSSVFESGEITSISVSYNRFSGSIPCPSHTDPKLISIYISGNDFTGDLPGCLFTAAPKLQALSMSYLSLDNAVFPPEIKTIGGTFVNLFAEHAGLSGPLPVEFGCLKKVIFMHLGRNDITAFPQEAIDGMLQLYSIDLSYNQMSGTIPTFNVSTELRRIYLEHNFFTGTVTDQFTEFAAKQDSGALSAVHLEYNALTQQTGNSACNPWGTRF